MVIAQADDGNAGLQIYIRLELLQYHKHSEIDFEKWDQLILKSENGLVYSMSWFLNVIHPGWEALIFQKDGEYQAVLPLLGKKKWRVLPFHPKPPLAQRLGLVHMEIQEADLLLHQSLSLLKRNYFICQYPLSQRVQIKDDLVKEHQNQILNLDKNYDDIYLTYRRDRKARLKQAKDSDLTIKNTASCDALIKLFIEEITEKIYGGVSMTTINQIKEIADYVNINQFGFIAEVYNFDKAIVSSALFINFKNRIIYLISATNPEGREKQANTFLLDHVIHNHANKKMVLDFEGSGVPGIEDFYRSFGSQSEYYSSINYVSPWIKIISKIKSWRT